MKINKALLQKAADHVALKRNGHSRNMHEQFISVEELEIAHALVRDSTSKLEKFATSVEARIAKKLLCATHYSVTMVVNRGNNFTHKYVFGGVGFELLIYYGSTLTDRRKAEASEIVETAYHQNALSVYMLPHYLAAAIESVAKNV